MCIGSQLFEAIGYLGRGPWRGLGRLGLDAGAVEYSIESFNFSFLAHRPLSRSAHFPPSRSAGDAADAFNARMREAAAIA